MPHLVAMSLYAPIQGECIPHCKAPGAAEPADSQPADFLQEPVVQVHNVLLASSKLTPLHNTDKPS